MKGIDYVAIDPGIVDDPRIALMAKRLRKGRYWVVGHFPAFFGAVATHKPDGKLASIPDDLLDQWAGGVSGFGSLVREHLCDDSGTLRSWWKYNGRALAKLQKDRSRKRLADSDDSPPDDAGHGNSTETPRKLHGNSTEKTRKFHDNSTPRARVTDTDTLPTTTSSDAVVGARQQFLAECPEDTRPDIETAFAAANDPGAMLRSLRAIESGLTPPAYPIAVIARAVQEIVASGSKVTPIAVRAFARRLTDPAPTTIDTKELFRNA